ncbi:DUF3658 domain-containing protein [Bradyrhizobium acaciae]|uniref:DUF3658 domain-containing protein n=1 Tax=Bradyrhizobium acaciae TaxID=2683706 RepID=UPI001E648FC6|nr:DUF3658 domain-containing protein [Bradyrhizobium acaciae]MCC8984402.1 hypothetical protein [Bradyrhizobium acaciae]
MNRKEAIRLSDQLIIANEAMMKARAAIAELGNEEQLEFDGPLFELLIELQWQVMLPLYDKFPDLLPSALLEELPVPAPTSDASWSDVKLPRGATTAALDDLLMSLLEPYWQKVALVLGRGIQRCDELGLPFTDRMMAARLRYLWDTGRIEAEGHLRSPAHSQVRLQD